MHNLILETKENSFFIDFFFLNGNLYWSKALQYKRAILRSGREAHKKHPPPKRGELYKEALRPQNKKGEKESLVTDMQLPSNWT